jgi:4-hydroxy-4-methyl-2-oxoglutarate aldolase
MATGSDRLLFRRIEEQLYVPAICDSLDSLNYQRQAMSARIRPLREDFSLAGRARTVLWTYIYGRVPNPYEMEIEFMDSLKAGDVVVSNTDPLLRNAPWGELMTAAAKCREAKGAVIDSCVRDVKKILSLNFPVFAAGITPVDSACRGQVIAYDVPVESGGVLVSPGDLIVADFDGVVVVPKAVEDEVMKIAFEKVSKEQQTKAELMDGRLLRDVYAKYRVL